MDFPKLADSTIPFPKVRAGQQLLMETLAELESPLSFTKP